MVAPILEYPSGSKKKRLFFIIGGIALGILLTGLIIGVIALMGIYKSPVSPSVETGTKKSSSSEQNAPPKELARTALRAAPAGYTQFGTDCYQVSVPNTINSKSQEVSKDGDGNIVSRCMTYDTGAIIFGISQSNDDPESNLSRISGCTTNKKQVDSSMDVWELSCPQFNEGRRFSKQYFLKGSKTKVGNYPNSAGGTITIGASASTQAAANALADDLYNHIGPP